VPDKTMRASIVICTWRRPGPLERCLRTLKNLGWGPSREVEVVTVHPPGNEESEAKAAAILPNGRIVRAPRPNLSLQRNLGAAAVESDVVVYLDDDAWPKPGWLDEILKPFEDPAVAAVGGSVVDPEGRPLGGPSAATSFGRTYRLPDPLALPRGHVLALPGNNLAVRRSALFGVGGFDENYRYHLDETDLCMRLARAGGRLLYRDAAAIHHESASGPHRKTLYDRDWEIVAKNQVYFAFRHVRKARFLLALVPWMLQLPKLARFAAWTVMGRLGLRAGLSCVVRHVRGTAKGYRKGLTKRPRLPLKAPA
jgi:GT2 family glycosyltransferase